MNKSFSRGEPVPIFGVIVPLKVERIALSRRAGTASVAGLMLTTDAVVSEIKEKDDDKPGRGGHGGHMH